MIFWVVQGEYDILNVRFDHFETGIRVFQFKKTFGIPFGISLTTTKTCCIQLVQEKQSAEDKTKCFVLPQWIFVFVSKLQSGL